MHGAQPISNVAAQQARFLAAEHQNAFLILALAAIHYNACMLHFAYALVSLLLSPAPSLAGQTQVDLQFAICQKSPETLARRLGFEKDPKEVTITYFDVENGLLAKSGIFLKLKEKKGTFTTEVKVENGPSLPRPEGLDCEIDRYGKERTEKCSLDEKGDKPTWTRSQKSLVESKTDLSWKELRAIGSFLEYRWKGAWELDSDLEVNMDTLLVPGRAPITELSIKTTLPFEQETYEKVLKWLRRNDAVLCSVQEGKIFRVLGIHK